MSIPEANLREDLGRRTGEILRSLGRPQRQVAELLGISQGLLSEVASGKKLPSVTMLFELQATLGVSLEWYLQGQGSMRRQPQETMTFASPPPPTYNAAPAPPPAEPAHGIPDDLWPLIRLLSDLYRRPGGAQLVAHVQALVEHTASTPVEASAPGGRRRAG